MTYLKLHIKKHQITTVIHLTHIYVVRRASARDTTMSLVNINQYYNLLLNNGIVMYNTCYTTIILSSGKL